MSSDRMDWVGPHISPVRFGMPQLHRQSARPDAQIPNSSDHDHWHETAHAEVLPDNFQQRLVVNASYREIGVVDLSQHIEQVSVLA